MLTRFFLRLYDYLDGHKALMYTLLAVLTALSVFGSLQLGFKEDISDFLPTGKDYSKVSKFVATASGNSRIMVFFQPSDTTKSTDYIAECMDFYADNLRRSPDSALFRGLVSKFDDRSVNAVSDFVQKNIPYFLDSVSYIHADSCISADHASSAISTDKKLLLSPAPQLVKNTIKNDPLAMFLNVLSDLKAFRPANCYSYVNGHIFEPQMHRGIIFFESPTGMSESNVNSVIVNRLRDNALTVNQKYNDIKITVFGAPVIAVGNSSQIKRDTVLTTAISIVLIVIILCFSIRSIRNILMITLTLGFGFLVAGAVSWLVLGEVSIISLGISATFTGIAANYPLHFITHLYHAGNVRENIKEIVSPLVIGNVTTVAAFLALMFAGSNALSDLGFIGGILLIASILFTLVFLPHLAVKIDSHTTATGQSHTAHEPRFSFEILQRKAVVIPIIVITPVLIWFSFQTEFDTNLHNINYMTDDVSKEAEHTFSLLNSDTTISVFVTAMGNDYETALQNFETVDSIAKNIPQIISEAGISKFVPSKKKQTECLRRWKDFVNSNRDSIMRLIGSACADNKLSAQVFGGFADILSKEYMIEDAGYFDAIVQNGLKNYIHSDSSGVSVVTILKVRPDDADMVVAKFQNISDNIVAYDEKIVSKSLTASLNDNFNYVLFTAGAIVFVFLMFSFGSVELSLISFVPLTVSWFWILGLMAIFGVKFNIVNIILATFIFGQGDDYAVFITEGLMYEYAKGKKVLSSFKSSVALSSLIMFVGIGSLILAQHPAMHSLGVIVIIGMFSVVVASFIFPPLLFNYLTMKDGRRRNVPLTLRGLFSTLAYFIIFLSACTVLYVRSLFLSDSMEDKMRFHAFMRKVAKMIYHIPGVPFSVHNDFSETFQRPAVILANHSSSFDVLCLLTICDKLLFVTNDKQQTNPFYGKILKKADFYAVTDGYDHLSERLRPFVDEGFSIVIFPEGTRSEDGQIHRFHQGAFHLSRQLGLDIVPVILHGAGHSFPKSDFIIRNGKIDLFIERRISSTSDLIAATPLETARNVRHHFISLYDQRRRECMDFDYARTLVLQKFLYKGSDVLLSVRQALKDSAIDFSATPATSVIHFPNCGYGAVPMVYHLMHPEVRVTATDPDADKILVAKGCGMEEVRFDVER